MHFIPVPRLRIGEKVWDCSWDGPSYLDSAGINSPILPEQEYKILMLCTQFRMSAAQSAF